MSYVQPNGWLQFRIIRIHGSIDILEKDFSATPESLNRLLDKQWIIGRNNLDSSSRKEIIIQLKALGILLPNIQKRSLTDTAKYWILTKYGENLMDKLCAIRRPDKPSLRWFVFNPHLLALKRV